MYRRPVDENLRRMLDKASEQGPFDLLLLRGDIAEDGFEATYARVHALLEPYAGQVLAVPGNHDQPESMYRFFPEREIRQDGWLIVGVDSHWPDHAEGRVSQSDLDQLRRQLVMTEAAHIMVAVHHPPHFMCEQSHCGLSQSTDLIEAVQGTSVRVVTSGHVHDDFSHQIGPILFSSGPSTCIGFDHNPAGHRASSLTPGAPVYDLRQMG